MRNRAGLPGNGTNLVPTDNLIEPPSAGGPAEARARSEVQTAVAVNRSARKWTRRELAGRALWELLHRPLFAWTPRPLWAWRRIVLRAFGAKIGHKVHLHPSVRIAIPWNLTIDDDVGIGDDVILYSLGSITIGCRATISQHAHLCAGSHDYRVATLPLLKTPITIGPDAWICADAFVGPGVAIGERTIVGARAVVMRSLPGDLIVAGNPARVVRSRPPFEC